MKKKRCQSCGHIHKKSKGRKSPTGRGKLSGNTNGWKVMCNMPCSGFVVANKLV